jgi:hypothetical protein
MASEPGSGAQPKSPAPATRRKNPTAAAQVGEVPASEPAAADEQARSEAPLPDAAMLERLRTRLIAKHHGRRR